MLDGDVEVIQYSASAAEPKEVGNGRPRYEHRRRPLIKIRMQQAICRAKLKDVGDDEDALRIWSPMQELTNGCHEEAVEGWQVHLGTLRSAPMDAPVILTLIAKATAQAADEAGRPYRHLCDDAWVRQVINDFLATFDPLELFRALD